MKDAFSLPQSICYGKQLSAPATEIPCVNPELPLGFGSRGELATTGVVLPVLSSSTLKKNKAPGSGNTAGAHTDPGDR